MKDETIRFRFIFNELVARRLKIKQLSKQWSTVQRNNTRQDKTIVANLSYQCVAAIENPTENRMSGIAMNIVSIAKKITRLTPMNANMLSTS